MDNERYLGNGLMAHYDGKQIQVYPLLDLHCRDKLLVIDPKILGKLMGEGVMVKLSEFVKEIKN